MPHSQNTDAETCAVDTVVSRNVVDDIVGQFLLALDSERCWIYAEHVGPITEERVAGIRATFVDKFCDG